MNFNCALYVVRIYAIYVSSVYLLYNMHGLSVWIECIIYLNIGQIRTQ